MMKNKLFNDFGRRKGESQTPEEDTPLRLQTSQTPEEDMHSEDDVDELLWANAAQMKREVTELPTSKQSLWLEQNRSTLLLGPDPDGTGLSWELCLLEENEQDPDLRIVVLDNRREKPLHWLRGAAICCDLLGRSLYFEGSDESNMLAAVYSQLQGGHRVLVVLSDKSNRLRNLFQQQAWSGKAMELRRLGLMSCGWPEPDAKLVSPPDRETLTMRELQIPRMAARVADWSLAQSQVLLGNEPPVCPKKRMEVKELLLGYTAALCWVPLRLKPGTVLCLEQEETEEARQELIVDLLRLNLGARKERNLKVVYYTDRTDHPVVMDKAFQMGTISKEPDWDNFLESLSDRLEKWKWEHSEVDLILVFDLGSPMPEVVLEWIKKRSDLAETYGDQIYFMYNGPADEAAEKAHSIRQDAGSVCRLDRSRDVFLVPRFGQASVTVEEKHKEENEEAKVDL